MTAEKSECGSEKLLPLFLDLGSRMVVIFGGGGVGERKAVLFSKYCQVTVVSKGFTNCLRRMEEAGDLRLVEAVIEEDLSGGIDDYLKDAFIAVPATNDINLNRRIEARAKDLGVLVNNVDG